MGFDTDIALSRYTGWGISEIKEMDLEEIKFWVEKAEALAERENKTLKMQEPVF